MRHHKCGKLVIITMLSALSTLLPGCAKVTVTEPEILCGVSRSDLSGSVTHNPILFVHGYGGANENFCSMIDRFRADGWKENELYAYDYSFVNSFATDAEEIRSQIDAIISRTHAQKVDIIAHSAGAVSSRYYIKHLGGDSRVDAWISLAGPNHGTDTADNCSFTPCLEIRIGSQFLADLNSGDETPGPVHYATWWSPCDETINPDTSVLLTGATNNETSCLAHFNLLVDPVVYQQVRDWVR